MDEIVPEPLGGSHSDPASCFPAIKEALLRNFEEYRNLTGEEIQLDRYAKFRQLGLFQEFVVKGSDWKNALAERASAQGVRTKAGSWAVSEAEAKFIEQLADGDEMWESQLQNKKDWVNRPIQPPGLSRSGVMEMAVSMVELRRRKQASVGAPVAVKA